MATPNAYYGMKMRGIGRAPQRKHEKKLNKNYIKYIASLKKQERETKQYERKNRGDS